MSDHLYVYTRKGLFILGCAGGAPERWHIERTAFLGDAVTAMLRDPRNGTLYAALRLGHFGVKLQCSQDHGATWQERLAPAYPQAPPGAPESPSVDQVWCLEAGAAEDPDSLWAGTIPGGLFRSADGGRHWELNAALWAVPERNEWFGGGYDHPGIHSILVHPRQGRRLTVAISCGGVWHSEDGGTAWRIGGGGLVARYMPPERQYDPAIQDPHRLAACPAHPEHVWMQHHNGVFRSRDGGMTWQEITVLRPASFGFAVAVHPADPETAWFVPAVKDECRIPVDGRLVVARTRDGGAHFAELSCGLPEPPAYDLIYRHGLDVDDRGERLAMGSTTGGLWVSHDQGDRWHMVSAHLPPIYGVRFGP